MIRFRFRYYIQHKTLFLGVLIAFSLFGCQKESLEENPEYVTAQFMEALRSSDYAKARALSTKETQASLDFQEKLGRWGYNPFEKEMEILRSEIKGQHAKVWFRENNGKKEDVLHLRKTGIGEWRVRISKADPASEEGVSWAYDWMESTVPVEKRWMAIDSIPSTDGAAAVAWQFLTALKEGELESARKLAETETSLLLYFQYLAGDWASPFVHQEFRLTGIETDRDTARVTFRQKDNNRPRKIRLTRKQGVWKVYLPREDLQGFLLENTVDDFTKPLRDWYQELDAWKRKLNF